MAGPSGVGSDRIFVYGLLKRGFSLHQHCAQGSFLGTATARGLLYSAGEYPAMVDGDGIVHGEVYRFADIAVALEVLDEVEGYDPLDTERSEYLRVIRSVALDADGTSAEAWTYVYNREPRSLTRIVSGDWRPER